MSKHYELAPCHEQPGRQRWHVSCALMHPIRFIRTRSVLGMR